MNGVLVVSSVEEILVGSGSVGSNFGSGSENEVSERFMVLVCGFEDMGLVFRMVDMGSWLEEVENMGG